MDLSESKYICTDFCIGVMSACPNGLNFPKSRVVGFSCVSGNLNLLPNGRPPWVENMFCSKTVFSLHVNYAAGHTHTHTK